MLINLRNALMAGKRLPYDAEVEYLESTRTQWIDTEVYGNLDSVAEITAQWTGTSGFAPLFGARNNYNSRGFATYNGSDQGYLWCFSFDNTFSFDWARSNVLSNDGLTHNIRIGYNCRVDNWSATWSSAGQFTTSNTLLVFAWNQNGKITAGSYRVYSCKIWDNGTLVRDYIPVRRGTVGYLYDRVSGKLFGNAGTGDFVLGPDVVPVEYIESHGTEYIGTGFKASNSTRVAVDFESTSGTSANRWILGARNGPVSATDKFALFYGNSSYAMIGSAMGEFSPATIKTGRHLLDMSLAGGVVVDSQIVATYSASEQAEIFSATYAMVLFNLWNGSLNSPFIGKYYACDFWDNGDPVRKFRPVRVGTDATSWEGAMIDTLTRRIYRNVGTGAFGYGNDLKYPIPA